MEALITYQLERPTRFGRKTLTKRISARKENIVAEVNDFIYERVNKENFIPVSSFNVKIFNYKKKVINEWNYTPTYGTN